jgi:hypothetical protein
VMDSMIRNQLKGEIGFDWRAEGLACEIILPFEPLRLETIPSRPGSSSMALPSGTNWGATGNPAPGAYEPVTGLPSPP